MRDTEHSGLQTCGRCPTDSAGYWDDNHQVQGEDVAVLKLLDVEAARSHFTVVASKGARGEYVVRYWNLPARSSQSDKRITVQISGSVSRTDLDQAIGAALEEIADVAGEVLNVVEGLQSAETKSSESGEAA